MVRSCTASPTAAGRVLGLLNIGLVCPEHKVCLPCIDHTVPRCTDVLRLPTIKPLNTQQGSKARFNNSSPEPIALGATSTSTPGASVLQAHQQRQEPQPQQQQHQLPCPKQAALPASFASTPAVSLGGAAAAEQHALANHLLRGSTTNVSRRLSTSSVTSRPRTQQHRQEDAAEEDTYNAQQQQLLQQLYGHSSSVDPVLEAAAGARIVALPFAICSAADGSLYEVATGYVPSLPRLLKFAYLQHTVSQATSTVTSAQHSSCGR